MKEEIVSFIRRLRQQNVNDNLIRTKLTEAGWSSEDIEASFLAANKSIFCIKIYTAHI